jgi:hypothetical protein
VRAIPTPIKGMVASGLVLAGASSTAGVAEPSVCQANLGYHASSSSDIQASVSSQGVYNKEQVAKDIPANMPIVTLNGADGQMSALNVIFNEEEKSKDTLTYHPESIRYADNVYLRFLKPLHLIIDKKKMHVEEWDVIFSFRDLNNIDAHLIIKFEDLYRKAQNSKLSEEEKKTWGKIVDSIDYASFSQEMSYPQFEVGQVTSLSDNLVIINWIDGEKERFRGRIPAFFTSGRVQKGDWFEALVKRGKQDMVVSIECPQKIDPPVEYDFESLKVYKL